MGFLLVRAPVPCIRTQGGAADRQRSPCGHVVTIGGIMGKNNKARRAAKTKSRVKARAQRAQESARPHAGAGWWPDADDPLFSHAEATRSLLISTVDATHNQTSFEADGISRLISVPSHIVDRAVEAFLVEQVDQIWREGWQPAELVRQARLGTQTASAGRLVALAVAADHANRRSATLDRRWRVQVETLNLPEVNARGGWVRSWYENEGLDRSRAVTGMVDALCGISFLPRLDSILPPPGSGPTAPSAMRGDGAAGGAPDPMLERVRGLLAMAESTTFEAEAIAFTAKAQELMTRHAIDVATLHRHDDSGEQPIVIRIPIDAPYADAKSLLVQIVAEAGRCRAVFHTNVAMSAVVGFRDDVVAVEMLFTSLLVQAQTALTGAAKHSPAGTKTRQASYRSAFLLGYTHRLGDRLREINEAVFDDAEREHGTAFLPVLRSRSDTVNHLMDEKFGDNLTNSPIRGGYDYAGRISGIAAANQAKLNFGDLETAPLA